MDSEFNGLQKQFLVPGVGNLQILLSLWGKIVNGASVVIVSGSSKPPFRLPSQWN